MKTFLSDFNILTNKRVVPHHSFPVQLTTISADDDIPRNDGTYFVEIKKVKIPMKNPEKKPIIVRYLYVLHKIKK